MNRYILAAAFVSTVIGANWALNQYGIVPIGFGLMAPAGVYFAGLAFGLRDALHETGGRAWVLGAIAAGAAISYIIEDGATIPGGHIPLAVASAVAFTVSELADLAIYTPLRNKADQTRTAFIPVSPLLPGDGWIRQVPHTDNRWWIAGVVASNIVGAIADSLLFLWLAFGSINHWLGNTIGKTYMVAVAIPIVYWARKRRRDLPRHRIYA